ncbi:MAG: hypothetical protein K8U57_26985 [Planctomycetes bacterium]|nr:hypothetical protein [Planctomycetota bacterium]
MFTRFTTLRFTFAVLALLGQLTPAVAIPTVAAIRPNAKTFGGCAPASCACPIIEKMTKGCCCSKPEPAPEPKPVVATCEEKPATKKRKPCCSGEHAAPTEPPKPDHKVTTNAPESAPTLTSADKCSCDRPQTFTTAEPAISPTLELPVRWFVGLILPFVPAPSGTHFCLTHSPQPPPPKA